MTQLSELEVAINEEAEKIYGKALNKNAVKKGIELIGSFGPPGKAFESLVKIFLDRDEVRDGEKWKVERKFILDFLIVISTSLDQLNEKIESISQGESSLFEGNILVEAENTDTVIGAHVLKPTVFKSGTSIGVKANNVREAIGLKIGE